MNERERAIEARVNGRLYEAYESGGMGVLFSDGGYEVDDDVYIDMSYLLARVRELEAGIAAVAEGYERKIADERADHTDELKRLHIGMAKERADYEACVAALEAALAPFAAVGAAVAARPAYPPTQELMRVGEASFTVAHLIAAADVLAVRAEAVGTDTSKGGIAEIAKGEQE